MGKRFITHLIIPELPSSGLRKLFFYTKNLDYPGEFNYGTDNYPFSEEEMARKNVIRLPKEVELFENRGPWINKHGDVFYADLMKPNSDPNKKLLLTGVEFFKLSKTEP